jgi:hypothetical protein
MPAFLATLDLLFPPRSEPFGLAIVEALAPPASGRGHGFRRRAK